MSRVLRDDPGLEGAIAVAGDLDLDRAEIALNLLAARAVAVVAAAAAFGGVFLASQVMGKLGTHRPLNQRLGQLLQHALGAGDLLNRLPR